jgi:VWFA-related protein
MRYRVMLLGLTVPAMLLAQSPEQALPRFRAGANLVRVDAYVSRDDLAVTGLTADDFELFEDDQPQRIENLEVIRARGPVPTTELRDPDNTRDMRQQADAAARLFTLFFDRLYVSTSGAYHVQKPLMDTLGKVIGPDDMIGALTPEMPPSSITYGRRTRSIEQLVSEWWLLAAKGKFTESTQQEDAIAGCYPPNDKRYRGIAAAMIARLREEKTLDALDGLITHLDGLREDRKFVMIFTEGWVLHEPDPSLSRALDDRAPLPDALRVDPATGRIAPQGAPDYNKGQVLSENVCDQLRIRLAQVDHEREFLRLLQRANRANVSFYPVDARGLVVFDQPTNFDIAPTADQAGLRHRWEFLRDMAAQTDGQALLDNSNLSRDMQKLFRDIGSYYLLSYYSTNTRLDGRFRRLRVKVKRDGLDVRARPGYLAPTEAEARGRTDLANSESGRPAPPPTVTRALDSLAPARGNLPARIQAAGGRNNIRAIVELDATTTKQPEWMTGGTLRLTIEPERAIGAPAGASQTRVLAVDPGQRSILVNGAERPLPAGQYVVRAELTARNSRMPIQVSTVTTVPADAAEIGSGALASRRGPSTGLGYIATADPRFRRTERLRIEVPLAGEGFTGAGRILTRDGQPTPLTVSITTRSDAETSQQFGVAEVALAPLAAGEYVIELSLTRNGATNVVSYGFRMIP